MFEENERNWNFVRFHVLQCAIIQTMHQGQSYGTLKTELHHKSCKRKETRPLSFVEVPVAFESNFTKYIVYCNVSEGHLTNIACTSWSTANDRVFRTSAAKHDSVPLTRWGALGYIYFYFLHIDDFSIVFNFPFDNFCMWSERELLEGQTCLLFLSWNNTWVVV